jgi:hypothetical protein
MSIIHADTDFAPSRFSEHYTPPRHPMAEKRFVRAVICLACFACIGVMLAACGGGEDDEPKREPISTINLQQCAAQPETCK